MKTLPLTPAGRRPLPRARRTGAPMDVDLARLAKALGHPARVAIVRLLLGKGDGVATSQGSQGRGLDPGEHRWTARLLLRPPRDGP